MCEIAVTPSIAPERTDDLVRLCRVLYQTNNDGLGIVAVHRDETGDEPSFEYQIWKDPDPNFDDVVPGIFEMYSDYADRFIIHARLGTSDGVGYAQTHPIAVNCDECDIEYVVHNGMVTQQRFSDYVDDGHEFTTQVDSELIAHEVGAVPDELPSMDEDEDWEAPDDGIRGQLNYLLLSSDGIFVRNEGKYNVTDDFRVACNRRDWDSDAEIPGDDGRGYHLFTPDGGHQFRQNPRSVYTKRRTAAQAASSYWSGYTGYGSDADDSGTRGGTEAQATDKSPQTIEIEGSESPEPISEHNGFLMTSDGLLCLKHDMLTDNHVCDLCVDLYSWGQVNRIDKYRPKAGTRWSVEVAARGMEIPDNGIIEVERCGDHGAVYFEDCAHCTTGSRDATMGASITRL